MASLTENKYNYYRLQGRIW